MCFVHKSYSPFWELKKSNHDFDERREGGIQRGEVRQEAEAATDQAVPLGRLRGGAGPQQFRGRAGLSGGLLGRGSLPVLAPKPHPAEPGQTPEEHQTQRLRLDDGVPGVRRTGTPVSVSEESEFSRESPPVRDGAEAGVYYVYPGGG